MIDSAKYETRKCPLYMRYPQLAGKIPWIALGKFPVPMHRMERLGKYLDASDLWVMREDSSGEYYGGNKVRKLEFTLADARKKGKSIILTMGAIGSNHVLATTIFAKSLGMKTVAILAPQPVTDHVVKNLRAYAYYGTKALLLEKTYDAAKIIYQYPKRLIPRTYFLQIGGSNAMGVLGFVNCAFEIKERIDSGKLPDLREIWVAAGSGGTVAGLMLGAKLCGLKAAIKGVRVSSPKMVNKYTIATLANMAAKLLASTDSSIPTIKFAPREVDLVRNCLGEGYGYETQEAKDAMAIISEFEGLKTEGTYTGKTIAGMIAGIKKNSNCPIMYIHTLNSVDVYSQIPGDLDISALPRPLQKIVNEHRSS